MSGLSSLFTKNCLFSKSSSFSLHIHSKKVSNIHAIPSDIATVSFTYSKLSSICLFMSSFFLFRRPNHSCISSSSSSLLPVYIRNTLITNARTLKHLLNNTGTVMAILESELPPLIPASEVKNRT